MSSIKKIYTIGYEGKSSEEFVEILSNAGIEILVDVRINANSRKKGFAKTRLKENLENSGINYEHHRSLGTPKYLMEVMRAAGHYSMDEYAKYLDDNSHVIDEFLSDLNPAVSSIALMCYELDANTCHRSVVANRLSKKTKAKIKHL